MGTAAIADGNDLYYIELHSILDSARGGTDLFKAVTSAPFHNQLRALQIDLSAVALMLLSKNAKTIDSVSFSEVAGYQETVSSSSTKKSLPKFKIPVNHKTNVIAKALRSWEPQITDDWRYLFAPAMTSREAYFSQAGTGVECSFIYPIKGNSKGTLIFSFYQPASNIGQEHRAFMKYYSSLTALYI